MHKITSSERKSIKGSKKSSVIRRLHPMCNIVPNVQHFLSNLRCNSLEHWFWDNMINNDYIKLYQKYQPCGCVWARNIAKFSFRGHPYRASGVYIICRLWLIVHKIYLKTSIYYLASWSGVQGSLVDEGLGFGRGDGLEATVYKRALAQNSFPEIDDDLLAKLKESLSG